MQNGNKTVLAMVETAILVALSTVLSMISLFTLPMGGTLTPASMLPVIFNGLRNGPKWGFAGSVVFAGVQMLLSIAKVVSWGLTPLVLIVCIGVDYLLAYIVLGVAGFFAGKSRTACVVGTAVAIALRFLCHFITGITIWAEWVDGFWPVIRYSLFYNGSYMGLELVLTCVIMAALVNVPQIRKLLHIPA